VFPEPLINFLSRDEQHILRLGINDIPWILILIFGLTGLILWWSFKGRGKWGALVHLAGALGVVVPYYGFVF
jgi:hypothetical protein